MNKSKLSIDDPSKAFMPDTTEQFRIAYHISDKTPTDSELKDAMSYFHTQTKNNKEWAAHLNTLALWINHIACGQMAQKLYYDNRVEGLRDLLEQKYEKRMQRAESAWAKSYDAANGLISLVSEVKRELSSLKTKMNPDE